LTTRTERKYISNIRKTLKEARDIARGDSDKATSIEDMSYYNGLWDAYAMSLELVRKLK